MPKERLQKIIAQAGITSRRKAEELILQGRVKLNNRVVRELGTKADPYRDTIEIDDSPLRLERVKPFYILLYKPKGYISSVKDQFNRPTVLNLIGTYVDERVYPVGRLDYDAEGVLLITNDGELAHRLIHPRYEVPKTYHVKVKGTPSEKALNRLRKGVHLREGKTRPAVVRVIGRARNNTWLEITVTEGRYRLIKRMCWNVGHPVCKLKRVRFAGIGLGRLKPGQYRHLTQKEVERLKAAVLKKDDAKRGKDS